MRRLIIPNKLKPFFDPTERVVIAYGGRSSTKSYSAAGAVLTHAQNSPMRGNILCVREKQNTMKDSVLDLLKSHLMDYPTTFIGFKLGENYLYYEHGLLRINFIFRGLSDMTAENVKSIPNIIGTWIEEGSSISARSMQILMPSIFRTPYSRLWVTMNRDTDHDPIWDKLCSPIISGSRKGVLIKINSSDVEAFLSPSTIEEREYDRISSPDFAHIWDGEPLSSSEGSVYGKQVTKLLDDGRYCEFNPDPNLSIFTTWDLGWGDSTAVIFWQKRGDQLDAIDLYEGFNQSLEEACPEVERIIKENKYKIAHHVLPFDAENHNTVSSATPSGAARRLLKARVLVGARQSRESGIQAFRNLLHKDLRIRKGKCERLVECLGKQLFEWNAKAKIFTKTPSHAGGYSNINDAGRYGALEMARIRPQLKKPTTKQEKIAAAEKMIDGIFKLDYGDG